MIEKPNLVGNIKTYTETEITTNEDYSANEEKTYYIVIWLSETNDIQTDTGDFSGIITFKDSNNNNDNNYPLLNTMSVGDYVAYEGDSANGCLYNQEGVTGEGEIEAVSGNSCKGENANQSIDTNGTYGYCRNNEDGYTTYGWRIAYIEEEKVHLISAGSPECIYYDLGDIALTSYDENKNEKRSIRKIDLISIRNLSTEDFINDLNVSALKYCNATYVDEGNCSSSNIWPIGNEDFQKITYAISGTASNLTGDYGENYCYYETNSVCGLGNDLIDNGGYYWFAATDDEYGIIWDPFSESINSEPYNMALGLRPIIKLSSSVYVTGGEGTMTSPYEIGI